MNYSMISYILGWIFNFEAAFMLLPGITAIIYRERDGLAFLVTMIVCLAIGIPLPGQSVRIEFSMLRKVRLPLLLAGWYLVSQGRFLL